MQMSVLPACTYVHCMCAWCPMTSEGFRSLRLELLLAVSNHAGFENGNWVFWKSSKCS